MELKLDDFSATYKNTSNAVVFQGRLRSPDPLVFRKLAELLADADQTSRLAMVWDLRALEYLNSAGLSVLYHFVNRKALEPGYALKVLASSHYGWQTSALPSLKSFMPGVQLVFSAPAEVAMNPDR